MTPYTIRIGEKGDHQPLFPEYAETLVGGKLIAVGILEGGMVSGKASLGLIVECEGMHILVELSGAAYLTIGGALKGAMERWGQPWDGA